ncbi:isochorismatase family protein [Nocardia sp. NPDC004711]
MGELGVTDFAICGIATDAGVLKTALDAFEFGFMPWVVRDAVAENPTKFGISPGRGDLAVAAATA